MDFQKQKLVIGITGHSGCGKTFVSGIIQEILQKKGLRCNILSADMMAKELRDTNPEAKAYIIKVLGPEVYDSEGKSIPSKINEVGRVFFLL
jgi:dephospho-CoA kinase